MPGITNPQWNAIRREARATANAVVREQLPLFKSEIMQATSEAMAAVIGPIVAKNRKHMGGHSSNWLTGDWGAPSPDRVYATEANVPHWNDKHYLGPIQQKREVGQGRFTMTYANLRKALHQDPSKVVSSIGGTLHIRRVEQPDPRFQRYVDAFGVLPSEIMLMIDQEVNERVEAKLAKARAAIR